MSKIINLRIAKKQKSRADKQKQAAQNRIKFGRTKGQVEQIKQLEKKTQQLLDGHQLDTD
ncbi:MAG: DUF4169 family protein [Robiginitomaculum sp.]|nr:DUF4169 family protein [Robiginitomaculum sp.]